MEIEILKKKLDSYRTSKGRLTKVPDELAYELLLSWEQWTGPAAGFYSAIAVDHRKVAGILGRAKKLKREGRFIEPAFREVQISKVSEDEFNSSGSNTISLRWAKCKVIRFSQVSQLVEFLDIMEKKQGQRSAAKRSLLWSLVCVYQSS